MSIQFPNLGINLDYVGKSIQIFGFEITFFGLVIALGMLLGMGFVILEAKRCGENKDDYLEMMIISLLLGVVGSRMLYVLCSWNLYKGNIIGEMADLHSTAVCLEECWELPFTAACAENLLCRWQILPAWESLLRR